jgi:hypothetical protein
MFRPAAVLVCVLVLGGCYHATVETGRAPSGQTIENAWAHSFIAGLVPPSTVNTASQCPEGVARVSTQLSFLNMLANVVTFGIYSPMTITVHCATAGSAAMSPDANSPVLRDPVSIEQLGRELNAAAERALATREDVYVTFQRAE